MMQRDPRFCMGSRTSLNMERLVVVNGQALIYEANGIAVKIAGAKYLKEKSYRLCWIINQSVCHMAYAYDTLNVHRMNAKEGDSQPLMQDTIYMVSIFQ